MKIDTKKMMKRCLTLVCVAAVFIGLFLLHKQLRVEQNFTEIALELGTPVSETVEDYISGKEWVLERAVLETTAVDTKHTGQYQIYCKVLGRKFVYTVDVKDTTSPEVELKQSIPCLLVGEEYGVSDFVRNVFDLSDDVEVVFVNEKDEKTNSVSFDEIGQYNVRIRTQDGSGNYTDTDFMVQADEPATLLGVWDRYVVKGKDCDLLSGVIAVDELDGIISEKVTATLEDSFDANTVGEYEVVYTVVDSNGLETHKTATLIVCDKKDTDNYAYLNEHKLSQEELLLLCEADYFKYEPLDEPDYDKTLELVMPTLINLRNEKWSGSGFIVEIGSEYIYCLSVEHVTKVFGNGTNITFFEDTTIKAPCDYIRLSEHNEITLFRIPTELVPYDTLILLKQIYVNRDIYSELEEGDLLIECCANWSFGTSDVIKVVTLRKVTTSFEYGQYCFIETCIETSRGGKPGMSGTPFVDYRGNLVAVASIVDYRINGDLSLKINELGVFEERITELIEEERQN